jgi:hypothetical protein
MTDLLDCICIYSHTCYRNCRRNDAKFSVPCNADKITIRFDPKRKIYMLIESIEKLEELTGFNIVGLEAWIE